MTAADPVDGRPFSGVDLGPDLDADPERARRTVETERVALEFRSTNRTVETDLPGDGQD